MLQPAKMLIQWRKWWYIGDILGLKIKSDRILMKLIRQKSMPDGKILVKKTCFCAIKMWGFTHQFSNEAKSVQTWACFMGKSLIWIDLGHPYVRKQTFFSSRCFIMTPFYGNLPFHRGKHAGEHGGSHVLAHEPGRSRSRSRTPGGPEDSWWWNGSGKLNILFRHIWLYNDYIYYIMVITRYTFSSILVSSISIV